MKLLHQASTDVVLAVPFNLLARRPIQDQADGELHETQSDVQGKPGCEAYLVVLPHFARNIVSMLELIHESVAGVVNQDTTDTSQSLRSEEFDLQSKNCQRYEGLE